MRVGWTADQSAAYLYDDSGNVVGRWFAGRPDISTFEPSAYAGGTTSSQPAYGGAAGQGTIHDVGQGGYYQDYDERELERRFDEMDLNYADRAAVLEENRRQFDQDLAYRQQALGQEMRMLEMELASATGIARMQIEAQMERLQIELASVERVSGLDRAERAREADMNLAMRLREIEGQERITAAERWAKPIDYLAYSNWMAGQPAATTASGLPVGAPEFQTGQPAQAVGAGGVPTSDPYGASLASGGRISEFGAWGGPTTPVGGTPWVAPHQTNLTQFTNTPDTAQQMAYARWRQRGLSPEDVMRTMTAAAPVGTAGRAVGYG